MIFDYKHHIVRDLVWALASPPLLIYEQSDCAWYRSEWFRALYESSIDWLRELDQEPGELESVLAIQKDRRLGRRFETLWAFWLEKSSRYEVIAQNLPLRDGDRTLGELDFVVLDKHTGKYLHWEMAVKFYLGINDTALHRNWHGPGKKDRLDKKVEHLKNKQSVMCQQTIVRDLLQEMNIRVDECGVILKGRLFYPENPVEPLMFPVDASLEHSRGSWVLLQAFIESFSETWSFLPLIQYGWMASIDQTEVKKGLGKNELIRAIKGGELRLPLYVAYSAEKTQINRVFIVPDDWSADI